MSELENKIFYHVKASSELEAGFIIEPGNWGGIILDAGLLHPCYEREFLLEYTRKWSFPNKPSRLTCNYVCPYIEDALHFQQYCQAGTIYEVKITDVNCQTHLGCYSYLPPPTPGSKKGYHQIHPFDVVMGYWQGKTIKMEGAKGKCLELLVQSSLEIIKKAHD